MIKKKTWIKLFIEQIHWNKILKYVTFVYRTLNYLKLKINYLKYIKLTLKKKNK